MNLLVLQLLLFSFTGWLREVSSDRSLSLLFPTNPDTTKDLDLKFAVESNEIKTVKEFAACQCANFKQTDVWIYTGHKSTEGTLLHLASVNNNTKIAAILLTAGVDPSAYTENGLQAIHYAANAGNAQLVELLLEYGADPDAVAKTKAGLAPLHYAAAVDASSVIGVLLDAGANVEQPTTKQLTPLRHAIRWGSTNSVKKLLEAGAEVEPPGYVLKQMKKSVCECRVTANCRQFTCNADDVAIIKDLLEEYAEANSSAKSIHEGFSYDPEKEPPIEEETPVGEEIPAEEEAPNRPPLEIPSQELDNLESD